MWSSSVRPESGLGAVGVDDDVVTLQAEEELLEHGVRVGRHLVRSDGLDRADGHARHDVLWQQGAARGLLALDRFAVGGALRELPHVRASLGARVRLEVGAVLLAQRVAEDQNVQRGVAGGLELGLPAHGQPYDHLRLHRKRRAVGHHRPPPREDEVHLVLGRGPAFTVAAARAERDQAGADARHLADAGRLEPRLARRSPPCRSREPPSRRWVEHPQRRRRETWRASPRRAPSRAGASVAAFGPFRVVLVIGPLYLGRQRSVRANNRKRVFEVGCAQED